MKGKFIKGRHFLCGFSEAGWRKTLKFDMAVSLKRYNVDLHGHVFNIKIQKNHKREEQKKSALLDNNKLVLNYSNFSNLLLF